MRKIIETQNAPAAIGAYSQGVIHDGRLIFTAGQLGIDPATGELVSGGAGSQADRAMRNIKAILDAGNSSLDRVLKVTIYLADIKDFAEVNEVYAGFFSGEPPARSAFQVAALPKGGLVEIECIAETM